MKKTLLLLILCLILLPVFAMQVNSVEAQRLARSWMSNFSTSNSIAEVLPITNPHQSNITDWYAVCFTEGGFILISAEDKAVPVLGYDQTGRFSITNIPGNIQDFFNGYHAEISYLRNMPNLTTHPSWQAVRNGDFTEFLPNRPVSPLLQTTWDQNWPYNSLCPTDNQGPGNHVYAGCGATTMGQIMKFWAHPTQGIGSHSYTHATYGIQSANFGATTYNYASMPNSLWFTANTQISTLLYHCGVALNMDYSPDGSGAQVSAVRPAFINYFNFESTAQTVYKNSYTATNWDNVLKNELEAGRPIFYFGTDTSNGGHAWVCDGYQGTNYFHMNWGWSGANNGYFYCTNLNPSGYAFNTNQGAVIGLRPPAPIAPPANLVATVDVGDNIFLEWESPLSRALLGYSIYKDGAFYTNITNPLVTSFYDINPTPGTYHYYIVANFSQGDSAPSNTVSVTIYPAPIINFQDSFESHTTFSANILPWYGFDLDNANTVVFDDIDFPSEGSPMSFIVFNPAETTPPMANITAFNGQKIIACPPADNTANNDWICSPKWNTGNTGRLRFWAKSAYADSGLAQIKVGISAVSPEPATMTIASGADPISVPTEWTEYNYIFSQNLYSNVFVGINCISANGSMLLLDRIQLWSTYVENEDEHISPITDAQLMIAPNPFRTEAKLSWQQQANEQTSIRIYDLKGRLVKTLSHNHKSAGSQSLTWDGRDNGGKASANGIYYCRLISSTGKTQTQKLILVK
jgi:hypothetical protein